MCAKKKEEVEIQEEPKNKLVSIKSYAELSCKAGFPLTVNAVKYRVEKGLMEIVALDGIEGYFIDIEKYPFDQKEIVRCPKPKSKAE